MKWLDRLFHQHDWRAVGSPFVLWLEFGSNEDMQWGRCACGATKLVRYRGALNRRMAKWLDRDEAALYLLEIQTGP